MDGVTRQTSQRRPLSRRAFLGRAGVLALALGGAFRRAVDAAKPERVSMRLGWLRNAQYPGDFAALDKG